MFNALFALFNKKVALTNVANISSRIEDILELFTAEYMQDKNAKNAAIDAVISILQEHKDK